MATADYELVFAEEWDSPDAAFEADYGANSERADDYAQYVEQQVHRRADDRDGDLDPRYDPTPDGTRPDGLYQTAPVGVCRVAASGR